MALANLWREWQDELFLLIFRRGILNTSIQLSSVRTSHLHEFSLASMVYFFFFLVIAIHLTLLVIAQNFEIALTEDEIKVAAPFVKRPDTTRIGGMLQHWTNLYDFP
jgi:hypothetical protein